MGRRPLVFYCPGKFSFGELQNAITVVGQLPPEHAVEFLVAKQYLEIVRRSGVAARPSPRGPGSQEATIALLRDLHPAALVVADHHLLGLERGNVSMEQLLEVGCPIIAMDSLCLGPEATTLQMALSRQPGCRPIHRWFPPEASIPALPEEVSIMRAVPVAGLGRPADSFDLYGDRLKPRRTRAEVFDALGVSSSRALVVSAQSSWAASAYSLLGRVAKSADAETYRQLRERWSVETFRRAGRPVTVLEITSNSMKSTSCEDVDFLPCPYQPMDDFVDILAAADLYVTDNLTSGAMAKAAALGTPVLTLVNQHNEWSVDPFSTAWQLEMEQRFPGFGFRFLVNPFGWAEELAPLLYENDYMAAVPKAEIYNLDACAAAIQEHLGQRSGLVTQALNRQVAGLPSAATLLKERIGS